MRSTIGHVLGMMACALMIGAAGGAAPTTRAFHNFELRPTSQGAVRAIPGLAAQQQALAKIKEIFAADYADTSFNARRALAKRLIDASEQTQFDWNAEFVLLSEARDLAAGIGDVTTAFDAIDRQAGAFPVIKLDLRVDVLRTSIPLLTSAPANLAAVSICMDLLDQCLVEGDYDRADALATLAAGAARRAKSKPHADWVDARAQTLGPLKQAWEIARPAQAALSSAPGDPAASLVMGRFLAFTKGDFDAGLNLLALCSDTDLAALARQDLNTGDRPPMQFHAACAWWDYSENQPVDYRAMIRRRAGLWYARALPKLDGLDRALAQRRLQELNPPRKPGERPPRPPDAVKLVDHWYRADIAEISWQTAQQLCRESGGQIVSIETRAEGELMGKLARGRILWLGASTDGNGKWTWLSGGEFFYTNWAAGEPSMFKTDVHPVMATSGTWRAFTGKAGFICEWSE